MYVFVCPNCGKIELYATDDLKQHAIRAANAVGQKAGAKTTKSSEKLCVKVDDGGLLGVTAKRTNHDVCLRFRKF